MPPILIEAAIDSLLDAERAVTEGARRLEVCAELGAGGLTPSVELLRACLALGVPCMAMARPRPGDFCYDDRDFERLCADASAMLSAGAHGIVFGCLSEGAAIDSDDVRAVVRAAENAETVFHRAFDRTPDAIAGLDTLIGCGVTRVLTSGHAPTAVAGAVEIAALVRHAAGRITVLPGGSVRGDTVRLLIARTGVDQVHARATEPGVIQRIANTKMNGE